MLFLNLALFHVLGGNSDKIVWNTDRDWDGTESVSFTCLVSTSEKIGWHYKFSYHAFKKTKTTTRNPKTKPPKNPTQL